MTIKIIKWIGDKMKNRKKRIIMFFLILIFLSCGKKENIKDKAENKNNAEQIEDQLVTFKDESIEKVINDFEVSSKRNKIEINKFEKLKYENQNFYKAEIMTKEDSNYTISSHGIDIKEDKLSNSIKYKNGITYAIQVERTGVLIFSAQ